MGIGVIIIFIVDDRLDLEHDLVPALLSWLHEFQPLQHQNGESVQPADGSHLLALYRRQG